MTGQLYTAGVPYSADKVRSSVAAMSADPIAYSLSALDRQRGRVSEAQLKNKAFFTSRYLNPAKALVARVLAGQKADDALVCAVADITAAELDEALAIGTARPRPTVPRDPPKAEGKKPVSGGHPAWIPKTGKKPENTGGGKPAQASEGKKPSSMAAAMQDLKTPEYTPEQKQWARAVAEARRTILNIAAYKNALEQSPEIEMRSLLNALSGGYVAPSSGGDAVANPQAVPTGRNLYAVNAEATPSERAWEKGVSLAAATLEQYRKQHGEYPRKVSYTLWSSEFIETEGATIAQVLYMLGVEPVRDAFGRVSDLQLIPSAELGRPRIDVVVQTSGQLRDLAASRLALISRAVEMAASSADDKFGNYVAGSTVEVERRLVEQGIAPSEAREMSTRRVFGGLNGMYGTGIQGMVTGGDQWEDERQVAETYLNNMGAVYGDDKQWGTFQAGLLRAVLHNTDVVVQPRQSNTWGALSLDHVYEFMGGMNLAVREVTGKDPDAYFADYRNRNNVRMQELKEAIGVESRSTIFNPNYIKEVMKGGASSAAQITEVVTNTYGWNVMKPDVIDREMWDGIYDVFVQDKFGLGVQDFYRRENPAAMQEITAVMMETARKGMWQASEQQLTALASLHTSLVEEFGPSGSGFAGGNVRLQDFIAQKAPAATEYKQQIARMRQSQDVNSSGGMVLKKEPQGTEGEKMSLNGLWIGAAVIAAFVALLVALRKKRAR